MSPLKKLVVLISLLAAAPAAAQDAANDPAFLRRAVTTLQAQRNQALDAAVVEKARADGLAEQLASAQAEIAELKKPKPDKAN